MHGPAVLPGPAQLLAGGGVLDRRPLLYAVRPGFAAQATNLERFRPNTEIALFADAGHALFVDEAFRFNALVQDFVAEKVWR